MATKLADVTGFRGEKIVELCLTDYAVFAEPLFQPGFLGDKWPAIDFYVELVTDPGRHLYFFAQVKTTARPWTPRSRTVRIDARLRDVARLSKIPGPTYLLGVHEPSRRVFARSVHQGTPMRPISSIPVSHELTPGALKRLHDEVETFWLGRSYKPSSSAFE
jgi:hypothetical protein